MKSIRKILFVMAALAAVFGFVACSNDDDEPSAVAVYERKSTWTAEDGTTECYDTYTVTFYDDNTYTVTSVGKDDEDSWNYTVQKGVYTGDPSKDGTIKMTVTKIADWDDDGNVKLVDVPEEDKKYYTDIEITISGGTTTIDGDKYTKK